MAVTAMDFLTSAHSLIKGSSEIDHRNAASRAYYCSYHSCKPLVKPPTKLLDKGMHTYLIDELTHWPNTDPKSGIYRELGQMLKMGRDQRNEADYGLKYEYSKSDAKATIGTTAALLSKLAKL